MTEENKIQELQMLEQNLQNLLMQKQAFQIELSETNAALGEVEKTSDDVFKIIGQLMIKTDKTKMQDELKEKQKILNMRTDSLEKQEKGLTEQAEKLREEVMKGMKK
jgi:prefoldin beta subunit